MQEANKRYQRETTGTLLEVAGAEEEDEEGAEDGGFFMGLETGIMNKMSELMHATGIGDLEMDPTDGGVRSGV